MCFCGGALQASKFSADFVEVVSPNVTYTESHIVADYRYSATEVTLEAGKVVARPVDRGFTFRTERRVPRTGVMIVGWGGNNGTTVTGGIIANREGLTWRTKAGEVRADYLGSVTQASTVRLGSMGADELYVPMNQLLPMLDPNEVVLGGWDISSMNLGDAMARAEVFEYDLQRQLYPHMHGMVPLPAVYFPDFIAANQADRADNVLTGSKAEQLATLRADIRHFKAANKLDKVIVLWSANTERYSEIVPGVNDTADNLLAAVERGESEIAPSTLYAVASVLEGCTYINGSPQNTFVPGLLQLAQRHRVFVAGDDFKSGQTKMKSVLVDFLVGAGIKPVSIVSYNHLGNNDGKNLSAPQQFRSKEISKSTVVDDMVASNRILYAEGEHPDHCVVIKYVPYVKDSKRAMDEYTSKIFMDGTNTIVMHNTCEDSLLAAPLIIDLFVLAELFERIFVREDAGSPGTPVLADDECKAAEEEEEATAGHDGFQPFHTVLSLLSYLLKAPLVPPGTPVVNSLFRQREALTNVMRACVGLPPESHMMLDHRLATAGTMPMPMPARGKAAFAAEV